MDSLRDSEFPPDLSPLAWVQEELRRSLEAVHKTLRRFLRENEARTTLMMGADAGQPNQLLAGAAAQIHQVSGVLSVVGLTAGATVLRATEQTVQRLAEAPLTLDLRAVELVERAHFALLSLIARMLAGNKVSSLALFPTFRELQAYNHAERVHPADLWQHQFSWRELPDDPSARPVRADAARASFESALLKQMRDPSGEHARQLSDLCAGLGLSANSRGARTLWRLAAAQFQAQALGLLKPDAYVKRLGSRLLSQMRASASGDAQVSERLAHDLLFFCAQAAAPQPGQDAARLQAVRISYGINPESSGDYEDDTLGRIDPAWVTHAKRRVALAKEAWGSAAEGETQRLAGLDEHFAGVSESLARLFPGGESLGDAMQRAVVATLRSGLPPSANLAMEIATCLLYVEAALDDAVFDHPEQAARVRTLAQRVTAVARGEPPEPLESWMEDLYRRVSDRQTLGSVVHELRSNLTEIERQVDEYFRDPSKREVLIPVPNQLSTMRGVLGVLGLDQAALACVRMRDELDDLANTEVDPERAVPREAFERLANNLGAMGFLIDMLSVQPQLAKRMFVFDDGTGVLSSVVRRQRQATLQTPATNSLLSQVQATAQAVAEGERPPEQLSRELEQLAMQARAADEPSLVAVAQSAQRMLDAGISESQFGPDAAEEPRVSEFPSEAVEQARAQAAESLNQFVAQRAPATPEVPPPSAPIPDEHESLDEEMLGIFIEEAAEVIANARSALALLAEDGSLQSELTTVRRAFHTLKGSSRMVGLNEFGEAAWACEQLYNARIADLRPADAPLLDFSHSAFDELSVWVDEIGSQGRSQRSAQGLRERADALRLNTAPATEPVELPAEAYPAATATIPAALDELPEALELGETVEVLMPDLDLSAGFAPAESEPATAEAPELIELGDAVEIPAEMLPELAEELPTLDLGLAEPASGGAAAPVPDAGEVDLPLLGAEEQAFTATLALHPETQLPEPEVDLALDDTELLALDLPAVGAETLQPAEAQQPGDSLPSFELPLSLDDMASPAAELPAIEHLPTLEQALEPADMLPAAHDAADVPPSGDIADVTVDLNALDADLSDEELSQALGEVLSVPETMAPPALSAESIAALVAQAVPDATPLLTSEQVAAMLAPVDAAPELSQDIQLDATPEPSLSALDAADAADAGALALSPDFVETQVPDAAADAPAPEASDELAAPVLELELPQEDVAAFEPAPAAPIEHADDVTLDIGALADELQSIAMPEALGATQELSSSETASEALPEDAEPEAVAEAELPAAEVFEESVERSLDEPAEELAEDVVSEAAADEVEATLAVADGAEIAELADSPADAPIEPESVLELPVAEAPVLAEPAPGEAVAEAAAEVEAEEALAELQDEAMDPAAATLVDSASGSAVPHLTLVSSAEPELAAEVSEIDAGAEDSEESVKVIGPLRISISLFNIFLNEADELSRRLNTELAEWAVEPSEPVPSGCEALAHALAGNAATVGYEALSELARALEHALGRAAHALSCSAAEAQCFVLASEDIRRLLHQFAAGFLKPADAELLAQLQAYQPSARRDLAADSEFGQVPGRVGSVGVEDDEFITGQPNRIDAELFPIFEEEARELLEELHGRLREWLASPGDANRAAACMRTLHTFKGGARLTGAMRIGEQAHLLESAIEATLANGRPQVDDVLALQHRGDALDAAFEALLQSLREEEAAALAAPLSVAELHEAPAAPTLAAVEPLPLEEALAAPEAETAAEPAAEPVAVEPPAVVEAPRQIDWARFDDQSSEVETTALVGAQAMVRVRGSVLERMAAQAGEVSIRRARLESEMAQMRNALSDLDDNLERLRTQLRELEVQAEAQMGSRREAAKASGDQFDPLEFDRYTRFQELTRMMAESVNDVATVQRSLQRNVQLGEDELAGQSRLTRDLQDDLLRTRMVEFDSLAERMHRVVRQASREAGKQAQLEIAGGHVELDRSVLERLIGAFEHLLRNSVIHGIETPERRAALGKSPVGTIFVRLTQDGNQVLMQFSDDGAGLDLPRIRERAIAQGLIDKAAQLSEEQLTQLIFAPGFSTATTVTELAGRGVGMDVVRAEVNTLGGYVETKTVTGMGTSFELRVPLTTALTQVVLLRHGDETVAVPAHLMDSVLRVPVAQMEQGYGAGELELGGQALPLFWLGSLMHEGTAVRGQLHGRTASVVLVRSAQQRMALHVDEVIGKQEVVVKNLGPQLMSVPGLAGISLLPNGDIALIYNPVALANRYGEPAREAARLSALPAVQETQVKSAPAEVLAPLVLVVDDSLTVRRVTQRLLEREGYRVQLAKDGLDAMERLAGDELPMVVLSDIEMPRMDGFDLVRNLRADPRLAPLPVIMITSRIAQKHRDYAHELGVDDYLGKPYDEDLLLSLIAKYTSAALAQA